MARTHASRPLEEVVWHDLECGSYADDLPHWRRICDRAGGSVLDLGCGTGRVALHLARRGLEVVGVDRDPALVVALNSRATEGALTAEAIVGDVRTLDLGRRFDAVIAPMQLLQLLGPAENRRRCLAGIATHLRPGGLAAFALVDPPTVPAGAPAPLPDLREVDGWVFSSLPTGVGRDDGEIVVTRLRQRVSPAGERSQGSREMRLHELSPAELEEEAGACGLLPVERRAVPPTPEHVGSTIVVAERA